MKLVVTIIVSLIGMLSSSVYADMVDQEYVPAQASMLFSTPSPFTHRAQTFTVGLAGDLTAVDLAVYRSPATGDPLIFQVRTTSGGLPTATVLETDSIDARSIPLAPGSFPFTPAVYHLTLSSPVPVQVNDVLALDISTSAGNTYSWAGNGAAPYTAGQAANGDGVTYSPFVTTAVDFVFRTYVEATPVPEPSSVVLCGLAALGFAVLRCRKSG